MRVTTTQFEDIPDTPNYSLGGSGFDSFNVANEPAAPSGPVWDSASQAYYDQGASGLYSYDGGNSWEPMRPLYNPQQDTEFGNFDAMAPENMGTTQYEAPVDIPFAPASWSEPAPEPTDYSLNFPTSAMTGYGSPNAQNPWDANNQAPQDSGGDSWWEKGANAIIGSNPLTAAASYGAEKIFGQDTSDLYNKYNEYIGNPIAETGAQLTPAALEAMRYVPGAGAVISGGVSAFEGLTGYDNQDNAARGLQDFGSALKQSGGNPLDFAEIQNENFAERPWYQQMGASAIFDPTNAIPIGAGAKAVASADFGDDILKAGVKGIDRLGPLLRGGEEGAVDLRAVGKVLPGPLGISEQAAETGVRTGNLLNPRGVEQLADYDVKDAMKVARDLDEQRGSVANTLMAEADGAFRKLGPTFTDDTGNIFLKNVPPSAAETNAGLPGALYTRVIERPGEYALTPVQKNAVETIGNIEKRVASERDIFGVPVERLSMDEGEQYMHRLATKPTTATQVDLLVNQGAKSGELTTRPGGGTRLGGAKDKTRIFDDPLEAVTQGVVYADPKQALRQSIDSGLKKAADAHVKGLLSPFAETASDRIPQALREEVDNAKKVVEKLEGRLATAEKRAGIQTAKGDAAATIFEAQAVGAKMATTAPTADIQTINRFIQRAQTRITALRQKGGVYADQARALSDMLDDARLRVADVMPQWEQAKDLARNVPPGRSGVPQDLAPALIGSDFTKRDAAIIQSALSGSPRIGDRVIPTNIPGIKVMNGILVPLNAIGDASATANQLAMVGATHRVDFVKNFGKVLKDSFDDKGYLAWEAGDDVKDAAKHGLHIAGDSGTRQDFQFGKWVEKVPVLKQTQHHFTRFGNRMRVDAYEGIIDTATKQGQVVDDLFKEQTARAVNRVTGVSNSRATDIEGIVQFAPNWLRSNLENIGYAATDGTLEGQLARQYMKNYITIGTMLVAGTAMATNRDLAEVLTPLDKKALARGEIKLNPNFMTMRVGGQDINVFGPYDSLARLATIGVDSIYRSMKEKDATQLFDFLGYAGSTKGSPGVKFLTDLIKGETFSGEDPLSMSATAKRFMPFTGSNIVEGVQQGKSNSDILKDSGLGFFGLKSNPMSLSEKLNKAAGGAEFWELDEKQRQAILDADPELKAQLERSDADRLKRAVSQRDLNAEKPIAYDKREQINEERLGAEATAATKYQEHHDAERLRKELDKIQADAASKRTQNDTDFELFQKGGPLPKDPLKAGLYQYYDAFDKAKADGVNIDNDILNEELARLEKTLGPEMWAKVKAETGQTEHAPGTKFIYDAKKTISDKGYWDLSDQIFEMWAPTMKIETEGKSASAVFTEIQGQFYDAAKESGYNDREAILISKQLVDKFRSPYDDAVSKVKKAYRESDTELMKALIDAGYYTPGKELTGSLIASGGLK